MAQTIYTVKMIKPPPKTILEPPLISSFVVVLPRPAAAQWLYGVSDTAIERPLRAADFKHEHFGAGAERGGAAERSRSRLQQRRVTLQARGFGRAGGVQTSQPRLRRRRTALQGPGRAEGPRRIFFNFYSICKGGSSRSTLL